MPSKEELMTQVRMSTKKEYSKGEVNSFINSITGLEKIHIPYLKKGDVFTTGVGAKRRPVVIVKIYKDTVVGMPLSTTEDDLNLCRSRSRFFGEGFFSKSIIEAKKDYVMDNLLGIYDNPKLLNKAIRLIKLKLLEEL